MTDQPVPPPPAADPVTDPGAEVTAALIQLSPDPFVQAALWRVWMHGPGLLDAGVSKLITMAYAQDFLTQRDTR